MVKKTNDRITITLPKAQMDWLRETCKKAKIKPSEYIKWILCRKAEEIVTILKLQEMDIESYEELQRIIQTKWLEK